MYKVGDKVVYTGEEFAHVLGLPIGANYWQIESTDTGEFIKINDVWVHSDYVRPYAEYGPPSNEPNCLAPPVPAPVLQTSHDWPDSIPLPTYPPDPDRDDLPTVLLDKKSAFDVQEGGNHYKGMAIQPAEYNERNKLTYLEGAVVKYTSRHRNKNGAQDLRKAIHCLELLLEINYPDE